MSEQSSGPDGRGAVEGICSFEDAAASTAAVHSSLAPWPDAACELYLLAIGAACGAHPVRHGEVTARRHCRSSWTHKFLQQGLLAVQHCRSDSTDEHTEVWLTVVAAAGGPLRLARSFLAAGPWTEEQLGCSRSRSETPTCHAGSAMAYLEHL